MPTLGQAECESEIKDFHKYMEENYDYTMTVFRPPMSEFSEFSLGVKQINSPRVSRIHKLFKCLPLIRLIVHIPISVSKAPKLSLITAVCRHSMRELRKLAHRRNVSRR